MAVVLDGPAGVVRPGSWWRTQPVTNYARDQQKIIGLLAAIARSQGGKKEDWPTSPSPGPDGSCPVSLANAIWDFQVFWKSRGLFKNIDGVADPAGNTLRKLNELAPGGGVLPPSPPLPPVPPTPPGPPAEFTVRDVRLFGWKPAGDVLEVNGDTPLKWMIDSTIDRGKKNGGNLVLKIMAHGLPGFVQCCRGRFSHPTLPDKVMNNKTYIGPGKGGISVSDLNEFRPLAGHVKRIEFHSCLVARIGPCFEANGHTGYDGNQFCFMLAQAIQGEVSASIHLQYYWEGKGVNQGMDFGHWNGLVFKWGPMGNIVGKKQFPYKDVEGPSPPGVDVP
jgi:hypothetical protein